MAKATASLWHQEEPSGTRSAQREKNILEHTKRMTWNDS
jgi:hypothetical protein